MMKKIAAILFSMFYLLVTAGTAFSIHYCHGMVKDIEVFSHSQKSCCGPQACSTDCCEDVLIYVQLDDEQISKQNIRDLIEETVLALAFANSFSHIETEPEQHAVPDDRNGLHLKAPPLWLLNCALTYYG